MKDLVKKTQFEKDVPFEILEGIVNDLKLSERFNPAWPSDPLQAAAYVNLAATKLLQAAVNIKDSGHDMDACKRSAIEIASTAIRFLKNIPQ